MKDRKLLTILDTETLLIRYPKLPIDYLAYLRDVGWGEAQSGHMIYNGPIQPFEVYPQISKLDQRVILGDDSQGFCLGYDFCSRTYGDFSDMGEWTSFPSEFLLTSLLTEPK